MDKAIYGDLVIFISVMFLHYSAIDKYSMIHVKGPTFHNIVVE